MYTKHAKILILTFFMCVLYAFPAFSGESAPLNPEFLKWQEDQSSRTYVNTVNSSSGMTNTKGYIPSPVDRSHLSSNPPKIDTGIHTVKASVLPSAYDLRNYSKVTSVKDQGSYGTCWAFASIGALESNYLFMSSSGNRNIDLSELHLAWFVYKDPERGNSFTSSQSGYYSVLNTGGNVEMSIAYLARMSGPVNESSMPYSLASSIRSNAKPSDYFPLALRLKDAYSLGDITTESERKNKISTVKEFIMKNGAVVANYYAGDGSYTSSGTSVSAYFDNSGNYPDHAVLIVGWDDNFSRSNFSGRTKPSGNGAWLIKNSWGTNWGNSGYFWMSYEQKIYDVTSFSVSEASNNLKHYGHDALGHVGSVSYNWAANVFKSERDNEAISEAGFYTTDNNVKYEIYIYDLGTSKPSSPVPANLNSYKAKISGTEAYAGYHTKAFNNPVAISRNHYFSVVVRMNTSYSYPTAIEDAYTNYASPVVNSGESWFASYTQGIPPANQWTDGAYSAYSGIYTPSNACIKAFTLLTKNTEPEPTPTPTPTPTPSPSYIAPSITTSSLPNGTVNQRYYASISASGTSPITWSITGNLPSDISMGSYGTLSGIPTKSGTFKFKVRASNTAGYDEKEFQITIKGKNSDLTITTQSIPNAVSGKSYTAKISVSKSGAYNWKISNGKMPEGLTLNSGRISGKPKEAGTFTFTVSAYNKTEYAEKKFTLTVKGVAPRITTSSIKSATTGTEYTAQLKATGSNPMRWTATGLPKGLTIDSSTGIISGIPMNDFNGKFYASVSNSEGSYSRQVRLIVKSKKPSITTKTLTDGTENKKYSVQLTASGSPKITWSYTGSLPKGLTLNSSGLIEGTPKEYGSFKFYVIASNNAGSSKRRLTLKIEEDYYWFDNDDYYDWFDDDWWWWFYRNSSSKSTPESESQSESQNVNGNGEPSAELHVLSDDVLKYGTGRNEDIVEVRAGMPVRFMIKRLNSSDDLPEYLEVYVDDKLIESITVSDKGEFTIPEDMVYDDFKVQVKAGKIESQELYISVIKQ